MPQAFFIKDDLKIRMIFFNNTNDRYGNKEARAILENGEVLVVFCWFDDEIHFVKEDLIGLTVKQARDLKQERDIAYLQS
jgi:hypothetical protein